MEPGNIPGRLWERVVTTSIHPVAETTITFSPRAFKTRRRTTYDESDGELIDMAIKECARIKTLIQNLQKFNRPSSGSFALLNIHSTIDSILLLSKNDHKAHGITVETNYAANVPRMCRRLQL
jgi:nitrogen-specific signal transduction histidine kinase